MKLFGIMQTLLNIYSVQCYGITELQYYNKNTDQYVTTEGMVWHVTPAPNIETTFSKINDNTWASSKDV